MSQPFDFTKTATGRVKIFGGNIVQVPSDQGGPTSSYSFAYLYANWASVFPNWIVPQLKRWKAVGANTVRCQGGIDGVLAGTYSQATYNTCITQLLSAYRSLGLWFGGPSVGLNSYGDPGSFTIAQWDAAITSTYNTCHLPNADIIAYLEGGNQETHLYSDFSWSIHFSQLIKSLGPIPSLLSAQGTDFTYYGGLVPGTDVDILAGHTYPDLGGTARDPQGIHDLIAAAMRTRGTTLCPIHLEEFGIRGTDYQAKADFIDQIGQHAYGHPDCAGMTPWGGFGPTPDGDWSLYTPPASGQDFNPSAVWADTVASTKLASFGPKNRRMAFAMTHPSQAVAAGAALTNTLVTATTAYPTVPGFILRPVFLASQKLNWTGTVTASAATALTVTRTDKSSSAVTVVAGPVSVSAGSSQAFSLAGVASGDATYSLVSSAAATLAGSSQVLIGNYSPTFRPISIAGLPLRFTSGLVGV